MPGQKTAEKQVQAEHLFESGQDKLNIDDYDGAVQDLKKAIILDPENQEYMSTCGSILADIGRHEEAIKLFEHAVKKFPDTGYEKYMYLGQLVAGEEGIQSLQKGLILLQDEASKEEDVEEKRALQSQIASGMCSMVELRMALMEDSEPDEIAAVCEPLLTQASQADAHSPEPKQVLASLRSEQGRPEEALQALKESMALWYRRDVDNASDHSQDQGGGGEPREMEVDGLPCPSYEFRFETAKLLVELDETTEDAVQILEDLLDENDGDIHVHYLLALAYHAGGDPETAREIIGKAETLMSSNPQYLGDESVTSGFAKLKEDIEEVARLSNGVEKL